MAKAKRRKSKRIFIIIICIIAVLYFGVLLSAGNFIYIYAIEKNVLSSDNAQNNGASGENKTNWLTQNSTDLYITSSDGLKLHAFFEKSSNETNRYVIICHGYSGRASNMSVCAQKFDAMGFNVLAVDARAHGESEGTVRGMGFLERRDIILWIDEILSIDANAEIVLYGISMGAATVMMTAGESDLPQNVICVIEDCGYTSVYDEIGAQVKMRTSLPAFPLTDTASIITKIRGGYSFRQASCVEAVKRCKIPTLFIHGSKDGFVPFEMLDKLYNAAACEKEKLVVEGAVHAQSASKDPELYWKTVEAFIDRISKQ